MACAGAPVLEAVTPPPVAPLLLKIWPDGAFARKSHMPKYLFLGSYSPEGLKGLLAEGGTRRLEAARQALKSAGGALESFYFAFGDDDFYITVDLPGNVAATAVSFVGNVSGTFRIQTIPLITPEEVDEAVAKHVDFRPPGH